MSSGVTIDLFQITREGRWLCPVMAYRKWLEGRMTKPLSMLPLLRLSTEEYCTGTTFNIDLKKFLGSLAGELGAQSLLRVLGAALLLE